MLQIKIDDNNVVKQCAEGCILSGGIEVDNIPDTVWSCPAAYIYSDSITTDEDGDSVHTAVYSDNPDYVPPTYDNTQTVEERLEALAAQAEYFDEAIAEIMLNM
jgi:hypothetical protein